MGIGAKSEVVRTQTGLSPQELITTSDRAKAVPLSSPLFNVCLTCIFNELMYVSVCLCVYECALLERWVYILCHVSCISIFLLIYHVSQYFCATIS